MVTRGAEGAQDPKTGHQDPDKSTSELITAAMCNSKAFFSLELCRLPMYAGEKHGARQAMLE